MLTQVELYALEQAARGVPAKELAELINVGESAIELRIARARRKLGARNTTHAVVLAIKAGLIAP